MLGGYLIPIVAVNNEDKRLRTNEVVAPERADLVLASNVPYCEVDVLIFNCFDVENGCNFQITETKLKEQSVFGNQSHAKINRF